MRRGLLAVLAVVLTLAAGSAWAKPPVWIIRDADSTIVLFGSIHLLPGGMDWRPQALTDALAKADDVWFEIPINDDNQLAAQRLYQSRGMLPAKDNLFNHLTADQAMRLRRVTAELGFYGPAVERMRPWFADVAISIASDARNGASASDGVEPQLEALAPPTARRRAFKSTAQQIGFLAETPVADQIASLDETLTEIEQRPNTFQNVLDHWMAGDVAAIKVDALDPLMRTSPVLYKRLISERNHRWVKTIRDRLAGHGVTVMVVGMGHLVGPDGVPALLRAQGVSVEGP